MQINELDDDKLRRLATLRADGARVLSIFLNLDPSQFATGPARATEVRSVLDTAQRQLREAGDQLTHDQSQALAGDIERAREFFTSSDFSAKGAHGLALFASGPAGLFEAIRLPRPIETRVVINDAPFIEPLAELRSRGSWCVLLVNRQTGRMLRGSPERLAEQPPVVDDVHGQHDQGGWSQARYQRSVEKEVQDHLKRVADVTFRRFKRSPFDRLLLGGPEEIVAAFEERLHPYLRERLAGRVEIDVENATPDQVRNAAAPTIERIDAERTREALSRLREGLSTGGRAAAGLDDVLGALNERRVEALLLRDGFTAGGCTCPQCGWVGSLGGGACPADGTELVCRDDVIENAVELAIAQSAEVLVLRDDDANAIESHGSIAAVLRF
jgi:peptide chain release factor subunit 1